MGAHTHTSPHTRTFIMTNILIGKKMASLTFRVCNITTCPEDITTLIAPFLDVRSLAAFSSSTARFHNKFRCEVASRKASESCPRCRSVRGFKKVTSLPDEEGWRASFDDEGPDEPIECSIHDHCVCVKCGACQGGGCWSCRTYGENYTILDDDDHVDVYTDTDDDELDVDADSDDDDAQQPQQKRQKRE